MFGRFQKWQQMTEKWVMAGGTADDLKSAFSAANKFIPWLCTLEDFPPGLDPVSLASEIISFAQTPKHLQLAIKLIKASMTTFKLQDKSIGSLCEKDDIQLRQGCQDLYSLYCYLHYRVNKNEDADRCIEIYNAPRSSDLKFKNITYVHRQLPGLRAKGWWTGEEIGYSVLHRIKEHYFVIKEEIMRIVNEPDFELWDGQQNDPRLTKNKDWNPRTAWDAIPIYFDGKWNDDNCQKFPITCNLLKSEEKDLALLFNISAYNNLVSTEVRAQGYTEVPTLGIKLYRVWADAGIKPHMGSPARLVNSLCLHAPQDPVSTLTVAGETRPWREGEMHHFDDSFFHSVDNPNPSSVRIVMAFVTWHPDLYPIKTENEAFKIIDNEKKNQKAEL